MWRSYEGVSEAAIVEATALNVLVRPFAPSTSSSHTSPSAPFHIGFVSPLPESFAKVDEGGEEFNNMK